MNTEKTSWRPGLPVAPFESWNAALLRAFFSPAQHGEQVLLSVAREELNDIAPELGGYEGLLAAVRQGPRWAYIFEHDGKHPDLCRWAELLVFYRRNQKRRPRDYDDPSTYLPYGDVTDHFPAYLPILAATVSVFAETSAFYETVRALLGLPSDWHSPDLRRLNQLWDDLAAWTNEREGRFGHFRPRRLGRHPHVGELRAQAIFRSTDVDRLSFVFSSLGLRPSEELRSGDHERLLFAIREEPRLSHGLRVAARDSTYAGLIVERAQEALAEWDGRGPGGRDGGATNRGEEGSDHAAERRVGVTLHLTNGAPPWRLGWHVEGVSNDESVAVRCGSHRWTTVHGEGHDVVFEPSEEASDAMSILEKAQELGEPVTLWLEAASSAKAALLLDHKFVRRFVYDPARECLVERDALPSHGPAYLLVSPDCKHFETVASAERFPIERVPSEGLPKLWTLWFVSECSKLAGRPLPGSDRGAVQERALRFVGGVRVRRSGRLMFLPYDLPLVELDAPADVGLVAEGLELVPEPSKHAEGELQLASALRRFRIRVKDQSRLHFALRAEGAKARVHGTATLRLATADVPLHGNPSTVGLDPTGGSTINPPLVTATLLLGSAPDESYTVAFQIDAGALGHPDTRSVMQGLEEQPEIRFLDSLAQSGAATIPYGNARDRLHRYLRERGRPEAVSAILRELRRRGMLEIVTDSRGRWEAVARTRPCVWRLPMDASGAPVWGVAGTLGLHHWRALGAARVPIRWERAGMVAVPVLRIIGELDADIDLFERSPMTSSRIAAFSASLAELRNRLAEHGFEQLDLRAGDAEVLNPWRANWDPLRVEQPFEWQLIRYTDPDTGAHRLLSLKNRPPAAPPKYRHMRDERWGTWLAYAASIHYLEATLLAAGAPAGVAPWPIHHDGVSGDLWLPKRLNLPYVLERAVFAASGAPPDEVLLSREPNQTDSAFYGVSTMGTRFGPFSSCYDPLLPDGEPRTWLRHRWVPRDLARIVAEKLGCRIADMSEGQT